MLKLLLVALLVSAPSWTKNLPSLNDTRLFTEIVRGCHPVNLDNWTHSTRSVLIKHHVQIIKVDLCNDNKYPIFYVKFPYDPLGKTKSYFGRLYDRMRVANAGWPYSFVALSDNAVLNITYQSDGVAEVDFEMFVQ